ncbi:MAG: hypothetical protein QW597_03940 [Thermoplasmataceae archaeon]
MVKLFGSKNNKKNRLREEVRTKIEVITIGDTPPIVEARKLIGENKTRDAVIGAFNAVKADYIRFFGLKNNGKETARRFLVRSFKDLGVEVPEEAMLDSVVFLDFVKTPPQNLPKDYDNRYTVLKKITALCLNYYERAKFADPNFVDDGKVLDKLEDIYTYMDITKLYFPYGKVAARVETEGQEQPVESALIDKSSPSPAEGLEADEDMINEMFKSGIINEDEYNNLLSKVSNREPKTDENSQSS